jgi:hypothetical protein
MVDAIMRFVPVLMALVLAAAGPTFAGGADIVEVSASRSVDGAWRFNVTVAHSDEGWDHYADQWQVLSPDGTVLGTRELAHPHVDEQPFTRSLSGVIIPDGLDAIVVRARDNVHGFEGAPVTVPLDRQAGVASYP